MKELPDNQRVIYQFGRFVLDPQEKTLLIDGQPIHLPEKEFETLLLLVENNGRALSKKEMLDTIWPGTFVEENNLAKYVSKLRKLLDSGGEVTIKTLPKHGYRFSAEVSEIVQPATETILEKRTTRRVTMRVAEALGEEALALPPRPRTFPRKIFLPVLVLIGLTVTVGLIWFWRRTKPPAAKPAESGIRSLTDGQFDDEFPYWTNAGRIYFIRYVTSKRPESWTMNADGSNQQRANTENKSLQVGNWSPDGKKVIFSKDDDPKPVSYLADADGKNEIVLPFIVGNNDWSPDSSQFVYQSKGPEGKQEIYLYTLATGRSEKLTSEAADPSFSPDGKQIAFTSWRDGNTEIYTMKTDATDVRRVTNHAAFDNYPVFSPDGTQIAFASNREDEHGEVYLKNLNDDSPPKRITYSKTAIGLGRKSWSADGTQMLLFGSASGNPNGKQQVLLANVDPYPARVVLSSENEDLSFPRLAPDGKQILYQARLPDRLELRLTNLETNHTKVLFKTEPEAATNVHLSPAWAPNGKLIVFTNKSGGNTEVFSITTEGTELKNLSNNPMVDTNPIFSPDGNEIVFVRNIYGRALLYRMNLDGSNQRRLTDKEGYEMSPEFSHDGLSLAFGGDREGRGFEIFQLDFKNPNEEKLIAARYSHDAHPTFSPDGKRMAFISISDGNAEIYVMNSDGTGLFRLTHTKAEEASPQFSKDGKSLIFASNRNGKFAIYQIELI